MREVLETLSFDNKLTYFCTLSKLFMTEIEKNQIIGIIKSDISELERKILELKNFTAPIEPDDAIGRVSRMDAINNRSIYEASARSSRERLQRLNSVLKTINEADFGICPKCHLPIPFERLKIRPEIRLCATCLNSLKS